MLQENINYYRHFSNSIHSIVDMMYIFFRFVLPLKLVTVSLQAVMLTLFLNKTLFLNFVCIFQLYIQLDVIKPGLFGSFNKFANDFCDAHMEYMFGGKVKKWNTRYDLSNKVLTPITL